MISGLLIVAVFTAVFAMVAKRLTSTIVTAPMVFLALGFALSTTGLLPQKGAEQSLHLVAEIALVVLLFLDAAQTDMKALRKRHVWPVRMLFLGLPAAIVLGTLVAYPFLPGWPVVAVALLAAILAPTDAALGQAVVTNPVVPDRVRRALTVESGLNDGLALPAILLFASLAAEAMHGEQTNWVLFGAKQLILGPLVGIAAGIIGGKVILLAKKHNFTSDTFEGIGALALAGTAYLGATQIGGNGFISAFVAGLCFGYVVKGQCKFVYEFTESEGQLLALGCVLPVRARACSRGTKQSDPHKPGDNSDQPVCRSSFGDLALAHRNGCLAIDAHFLWMVWTARVGNGTLCVAHIAANQSRTLRADPGDRRQRRLDQRVITWFKCDTRCPVVRGQGRRHGPMPGN